MNKKTYQSPKMECEKTVLDFLMSSVETEVLFDAGELWI